MQSPGRAKSLRPSGEKEDAVAVVAKEVAVVETVALEDAEAAAEVAVGEEEVVAGGWDEVEEAEQA